MIEIVGILVICYLLIGMEAIVPGGILGVLGFIGLFIAAYFAHLEYGNWFAPSLTFLLGGFGALILVFVEFKWLSKSPFGKNLFLKESITGSSNEMVASPKIVGKNGMTLTDLHPEGRVKVEDGEYDAFSESGLIPSGVEIKIISIENFRVRVRTH